MGPSGLALAAAARDKLEVVLTDRDAAAIDLAKANIAANKLETCASAQMLDWAEGGAAEALGPVAGVIAADVVYHEDAFVPLVVRRCWFTSG